MRDLPKLEYFTFHGIVSLKRPLRPQTQFALSAREALWLDTLDIYIGRSKTNIL